MKLFAAGAAIGLAIGFLAPVRADEAPTDDTIAAAKEADVSPTDLQGAVNSQPGTDARTYLTAIGELEVAVPNAPNQGVSDAGDRNLQPVAGSVQANCIIQRESGGRDVYNRQGSGAAGPGQYFQSTWASHVALYRAATGYTAPLSLHSLSDVRRVMSFMLAAYPRTRSAWSVGGCN